MKRRNWYREFGEMLREEKKRPLPQAFFRGFAEEAMKDYFRHFYGMSAKHAEIMGNLFVKACLK